MTLSPTCTPRPRSGASSVASRSTPWRGCLDLEATDEDVRDEFVKAGIEEDVEDEIENWRNQGRLPAIHDSIKRTKALDWLVENATVTEVDEDRRGRRRPDETDSATEE